jgi:hypothetical protein
MPQIRLSPSVAASSSPLRVLCAAWPMLALALFTLLALPLASAQAVSGNVAVPLRVSSAAGDLSATAANYPTTTPMPAFSADIDTALGGVADGAGNLYIILYGCCGIYNGPEVVEVTGRSTGNPQVVVVAGGQSGFNSPPTPNINYPVPATSVYILPNSIAVDNAGNLYISDDNTNMVEEVTGISSGNPQIIAIAGGGTHEISNTIPQIATSVTLSVGSNGQSLGLLAVDNAGNLYITGNNPNGVVAVDKLVLSTGKIICVAGGGTVPATPAYSESSLTTPQPANSVVITNLSGMAVDKAGNLYIADAGNNPAELGLIEEVTGLSTANPLIRVVAGMIQGFGGLAFSGNVTSPVTTTPQNASSVQISPQALTMDSAGNVYFIDESDYEGFNRPYIIDELTGLSTTNPQVAIIAGSTNMGTAPPLDVHPLPLSGPAISEYINFEASEIWSDQLGNIYFSELTGGDVPSQVGELSTNTTLPTTAVGAASASQNISVELTAASAISSITVPKAQNGAQEFTVGAVTGCATDGVTSNAAGTICTVPITFNPQYPGLRTGALTVNNGSSIVGTVGLTGMGTGPLGIFQPGTASVLNTGSLTLANPFGVAVDGAGDLYIADTGNSRVVEVTAAGVSSVLSTGGLTLYQTFSVAVDGAGDVYITDTGNNRVVEVTAAGTASVLSTGSLTLNQPFSVAVDGAGDLYIADTGNNRVVEVTAAGVASVLSTGGLTLSHPFGVAVDGAGDVYIADANNSRVVEVTTTGTASVLSTGGLTLNQPFSVAVDGAGDLYITDTGNNRVVEVTAAGTASVLSTGSLTLADRFSVAVDGAGDLYIADYGNSRVVKINQASQALSFTSTGTGDSSAQQTMTVENIGNQPLNFTALNITTTGLTTSIFDLNGPTTCTDSTSLVAGAACNLGVEFAPTTPGNFTGTVNITDNNAAGAVQQATLSGTGTGYAASILLSENPSSSVTYGTPVTVTATLSGSNGTPIGNITYTLDGVMQPSVALSPTSGNGVASFTLPGTLSVGTHSVLVNYAGDNNYTESTLESSFNLTVNAVATTTTLAQPSSSTITAGGSVTLTATVVVGSTPVTSGTVTFASGTTSIGAAQLNASGVATLTTTTLPVGTDSITASFVGTANDAASNSTPAVTVTVNAATGPGVTLAPSNLSFGSTVVGTPAAAAQSVTLTNNGTSPLTISAITATGDFALDPSTTCSTSNQVAAGGSCTVAVSFVPTAAGTRTGTVTISDNASGGTQVIALTGAATAPGVTLAPSNLSFGSTVVGTPAAAAQSVTLTNNGTSPLTISAITATGDFALDPSTTCSTSNQVAAGGSCTVAVSFVPTAAGTRTGTVTISDNASGGTQVIALTGAATAPGVTLAPSNLSFGSTVVGTPAAAAQSVTLTNNGTSPLTISAITATGDFALDPSTTCSTSNQVAAGGSCTVAVSFVPTAAGTRTGTVTISDNASGGTQVIALTGAATAPGVTLAPSNLSFGSTVVGTPAAAAQSVTLTNNGTSPLTISAITATGDFAQDPSTTCSTSNQVAAGGSCTVAVSFVPTAAGTRTGTVTISDNASGGTQVIALTGAATAVAAAITTTTLTALPSTITAGGSVTLTATVVVGSTPVTSGTVTFASGTTSIGAAQLNASGVATLTTTTLPVGTDSITASFVDTANDAASNSTPAVTVTVNAATGPGAAAITTTTLTALPSTITAGSGVTLTATVSVGTTPVTSGTVTFSSGSTSIGAAQLNSTGNAVLTTTILPTGSDSITASFVGTANDAASNSTPLTITVNAAPPATNASYFITASPTSLSIAQGQTGTTTLTLTPTGGYTGTLVLSCGNLPSYVTCTFSQGGATNNTVTLGSSGQSGSVILTIQTNVATARLEAMPAFRPASPQTPSSPLLPAMLIGWPGGLAGVVVAFKRRRKGAKQPVRLMPLCLLVLLTGAMAVGLSGCGGSNMMTSTPMGVSTIVVTATSTTSSGQTSGASQSLPLTITISQ